MTVLWPWQRSPIFYDNGGGGGGGGGLASGSSGAAYSGGGGGSLASGSTGAAYSGGASLSGYSGSGGSEAQAAAELAREEAEKRLAELMRDLALQAAAGKSDPTQQAMAAELAKAAGKPTPVMPSAFTSQVRAPGSGQTSFALNAPTTPTVAGQPGAETGNMPAVDAEGEPSAPDQASDKVAMQNNPMLDYRTGTLWGATDIGPTAELASVPADTLPAYLNPLTESPNLLGLGTERTEGPAEANKQAITLQLQAVAQQYRDAKPSEREALKSEYKDLQNALRAAENKPTGPEQYRDMMSKEYMRLSATPEMQKYNNFLMNRGIDPYSIGPAAIQETGEMNVPSPQQELAAVRMAEELGREWAHMPPGPEKLAFGLLHGGVDLSNPTAGWNRDNAVHTALQRTMGPKGTFARGEREGLKSIAERQTAQAIKEGKLPPEMAQATQAKGEPTAQQKATQEKILREYRDAQQRGDVQVTEQRKPFSQPTRQQAVTKEAKMRHRTQMDRYRERQKEFTEEELRRLRRLLGNNRMRDFYGYV